jgi:hypothetical protein
MATNRGSRWNYLVDNAGESQQPGKSLAGLLSVKKRLAGAIERSSVSTLVPSFSLYRATEQISVWQFAVGALPLPGYSRYV